jgi:hypothetical protein
MMDGMSEGRAIGRREFLRTAGRILALGLAAAGAALLWRKGRIDLSAPRCRLDDGCRLCPTRGGCARLRARRKEAHGGA